MALASSTCRAIGVGAPLREEVEARLRGDQQHEIKAVVVVHNETSTGVTSRIGGFAAPCIVHGTRHC